jgi:hypothetical protein
MSSTVWLVMECVMFSWCVPLTTAADIVLTQAWIVHCVAQGLTTSGVSWCSVPMKMSLINVECGMSPYADGMKEVMLNTSELVLRRAPWGTCHPHEDMLGWMPSSDEQYRVMSEVMSVHS